ncbi:hypothetical protein WICMUC_005833 [Wickerhamomyces mucosus]|uniref:Uncharacterized protein n=1 Tax=Wickerhamomyces mucosus TaxID=1378264 RepID=A0A9P8P269_9ASCO|nr:hypothetical protein WICMUC_005833 [Wickerhamomyces mucosus]
MIAGINYQDTIAVVDIDAVIDVLMKINSDYSPCDHFVAVAVEIEIAVAVVYLGNQLALDSEGKQSSSFVDSSVGELN